MRCRDVGGQCESGGGRGWWSVDCSLCGCDGCMNTGTDWLLVVGGGVGPVRRACSRLRCVVLHLGNHACFSLGAEGGVCVGSPGGMMFGSICRGACILESEKRVFGVESGGARCLSPSGQRVDAFWTPGFVWCSSLS
jgi:hypothetical protein